jgi:NAD(P)-dependent dehydrogenase (short-subunit alcohol dehydrogenase family)
MGRLEGKGALITGIASGIGAACAVRFAEEGARIAGLDVAKPPEELRGRLASAMPVFRDADVREEGAVQAAVQAALEHLGRLDVVVNAAGVGGLAPVHLLPVEEWDRVVDINLKGTYLVCKHALAPMLAQGSGSIVNLASIQGLEAAMDGTPAYIASKGGVILLTRSLAVDYGARGIRVNCLCPGFIDTPLVAGLKVPELASIGDAIRDAHMARRFGRPEEVAAAALFLASDEASFVNGAALTVDGGYTAGRHYGILDTLGI